MIANFFKNDQQMLKNKSFVCREIIVDSSFDYERLFNDIFFRQLPQNSYLQFTYFCSRDSEYLVKDFRERHSVRGGNIAPMIDALCDEFQNTARPFTTKLFVSIICDKTQLESADELLTKYFDDKNGDSNFRDEFSRFMSRDKLQQVKIGDDLFEDKPFSHVWHSLGAFYDKLIHTESDFVMCFTIKNKWRTIDDLDKIIFREKLKSFISFSKNKDKFVKAVIAKGDLSSLFDCDINVFSSLLDHHLVSALLMTEMSVNTGIEKHKEPSRKDICARFPFEFSEELFHKSVKDNENFFDASDISSRIPFMFHQNQPKQTDMLLVNDHIIGGIDTKYRNSLIFGYPGSGKVVFSKTMAFLAYARGEKVIFFTRDFENMLPLSAAPHQVIHISEEDGKSISLNPFSLSAEGLEEPEKSEFFESLVDFVLAYFNIPPSSINDPLHEQPRYKLLQYKIFSIINEYYNVYGRELELKHIVSAYLNDDSSDGNDYKEVFLSFDENEPLYQRHFSGKSCFALQEDIVIMKLSERYYSTPVYDKLVASILLHLNYSQRIFSYKTHVNFFYDEFFSCNSSNLRLFERFYYSGRMANWKMHILAQSFGKLLDKDKEKLTRIGKLILSNSHNLLLMKVPTEDLELMEKLHCLSADVNKMCEKIYCNHFPNNYEHIGFLLVASDRNTASFQKLYAMDFFERFMTAGKDNSGVAKPCSEQLDDNLLLNME